MSAHPRGSSGEMHLTLFITFASTDREMAISYQPNEMFGYKQENWLEIQIEATKFSIPKPAFHSIGVWTYVMQPQNLTPIIVLASY